MYKKIGFQAADLDEVCELDHSQWEAFDPVPDALGIKEVGLVKGQSHHETFR